MGESKNGDLKAVPPVESSGKDIGGTAFSLLPSVGREMSTSQSAVMLCGWGLKAGMVHSTRGKTWVAGKTV